MATNKRYRYFLYSKQQYLDRTKIEASIGYKYIPGRVIKTGAWRDFTEISANPSSNKYPDSKVVAEGYLDEIKYEAEKRGRKEK